MIAAHPFPPPAAAVSLYRGPVMHARMRPVPHRFSYDVFSIAIDLDRLEEAGTASALFSVDRANVVSFRQSDHGPCDGTPLASHARRLLAEAGLAAPVARVLLLAYPRILGYVFNPISVYFAYGDDGALLGAIYEVRNTFGELHHYVAPVEDGELSTAGLRQERTKAFHVSPFLGMDLTYRFRVVPPGDEVRLRILEEGDDGPVLSATFAGRREAMTTTRLLRTLSRLPLMTIKVIAAIHLEALRLWIKGLRIHRHPDHAGAPPA